MTINAIWALIVHEMAHLWNCWPLCVSLSCGCEVVVVATPVSHHISNVAFKLLVPQVEEV
jgi:tryptophan-rich sensory protein